MRQGTEKALAVKVLVSSVYTSVLECFGSVSPLPQYYIMPPKHKYISL